MNVLDFARERCIHDPVVVSLLALANLGIFAAYTWIPISILRVATSLRRVPAKPLWGLFGTFIAGCGLTHACSVLVLFRPAYYLEVALCICTAMVSIVTAIVLQRSVPELRRLFSEFGKLEENRAP